MKINKSELARKMNVDRRTIQKYLDGFKKSEGRNRMSKLDAYYANCLHKIIDRLILQ